MRVTVYPALTESEAEELAGRFMDETCYDRLVTEDCDLYKPDGSPLLIYRKNVLPAALCEQAWRSLRKAAAISENRGVAAGVITSNEDVEQNSLRRWATVAVRSKMRFKNLKQDGTVSNTNYAKPVLSGIVGYFDRNARFPYCRQTAFTMNQREKFEAALPFVRAVDAVFARELPDRYAAQQEYINRTSPDFRIPGTVFTTITVNKNWQTALHQDKGDLKAGFGVMAVLQAGSYAGGYLVFPRWRVAVDMRSRGVCLADVHEWHGNTAIEPVDDQPHERISCVFYYRENMTHCGTAAQELERAKNRKRGSKING